MGSLLVAERGAVLLQRREDGRVAVGAPSALGRGFRNAAGDPGAEQHPARVPRRSGKIAPLPEARRLQEPHEA